MSMHEDVRTERNSTPRGLRSAARLERAAAQCPRSALCRRRTAGCPRHHGQPVAAAAARGRRARAGGHLLGHHSCSALQVCALLVCWQRLSPTSPPLGPYPGRRPTSSAVPPSKQQCSLVCDRTRERPQLTSACKRLTEQSSLGDVAAGVRQSAGGTRVIACSQSACGYLRLWFPAKGIELSTSSLQSASCLYAICARRWREPTGSA